MRINQCRYDPKRISKFKYFLEVNKLRDYSDKKAPAIFFGLYSKLCFKDLRDHKGLAIVIWRGSDIFKKDRLQSVIKLNNNNIKHIAISRSIEQDLKAVKIKYKSVPLPGVKISDILPEPLGNEIYAYVSPKRFQFYGGHLLKQIKDRIPFKLNINTSCNKYTREQLMQVYKNSFMGLRLTEHDGIANQVIEMGLMGRVCVHNGNHPNAVLWKTVDDIVKVIEKEGLKIGSTQTMLSTAVKQYIDVNQKWLDTGYWRK